MSPPSTCADQSNNTDMSERRKYIYNIHECYQNFSVTFSIVVNYADGTSNRALLNLSTGCRFVCFSSNCPLPDFFLSFCRLCHLNFWLECTLCCSPMFNLNVSNVTSLPPQVSLPYARLISFMFFSLYIDESNYHEQKVWTKPKMKTWKMKNYAVNIYVCKLYLEGLIKRYFYSFIWRIIILFLNKRQKNCQICDL